MQNTYSNAWTRVPGFCPSMVMYDLLHVLDLSLIPDCSASATRLHIYDVDMLNIHGFGLNTHMNVVCSFWPFGMSGTS